MIRHKSTIKASRQNERRRARNRQLRSKIKTAIKKVRTNEDKEKSAAELKMTISLLDKMAARGIIHKNKAANLKSKLTKTVNRS